MTDEGAGGKKDLWKPVLLIVAVIAVMVASQVLGVGNYLKAMQGWIAGLGILGPVVFLFIYAAATVAALPGSVMTIFAGAIFGPVIGVATVITGATLGASLAFLVSRYLARDAVAAWLGRKEKFRKLDEMTERQGAIMVAVTRLVPLFPFNLLNYGFGLTKVPFWTYVGWSFLCMLPGTILFVVGASAVTSALAEGRIPWVLVAVVAVIVVILVLLTKAARRKITSGENAEGAGPEKAE